MQPITEVSPRAQSTTVDPPRLVRASHEFEAQMMKELLRPLTSGAEDDAESGSFDALADFAGGALGQALSSGGGFGIAKSILRSLS